MPKVSSLDKYLHAEDIEEGDIITVVGRAKKIDAETSKFGRPYFEFPVKLPNGLVKSYTPNPTTLRNVAKQFGDEIDEWLGEQIKLSISTMNVRGEMRRVIFGEPYLEPANQHKPTEQVNL